MHLASPIPKPPFCIETCCAMPHHARPCHHPNRHMFAVTACWWAVLGLSPCAPPPPPRPTPPTPKCVQPVFQPCALLCCDLLCRWPAAGDHRHLQRPVVCQLPALHAATGLRHFHSHLSTQTAAAAAESICFCRPTRRQQQQWQQCHRQQWQQQWRRLWRLELFPRPRQQQQQQWWGRWDGCSSPRRFQLAKVSEGAHLFCQSDHTTFNNIFAAVKQSTLALAPLHAVGLTGASSRLSSPPKFWHGPASLQQQQQRNVAPLFAVTDVQ